MMMYFRVFWCEFIDLVGLFGRYCLLRDTDSVVRKLIYLTHLCREHFQVIYVPT